MLTKLTLTIDKEIVLRAKKYALLRHRSVSRIVEEYLKNLSDMEKSSNEGTRQEGVLTARITGMFMEEYKGQPYKELRESSLREEHSL
ncbi:MAG: DUF6364 family protein [Spirochaetota bacterium]